MLGTNPKRSVIFDQGDILSVKNIFKTIQGEGPLVGMPGIFIRLGGCNLACEFCDTDFEDFSSQTLEEIISKVLSLSSNTTKLVVITGGEPLRQPIEKLCILLLDLKFIVQIETNGTLFRSLPDEVMIICSPKAHNNKYYNIREDLLPKLSAIKFLISQRLVPYNNVAEIGQTKYNIPVFVQSMDENDPVINKGNIELATAIALKYGYRLSLQIHKILGIE